MKPLFKVALCVLGMIIIVGYAGRFEYAEQVIYNLSESQYYQIKKDLGGEASSIEIADKYNENKQYYDRIK